MRTYRFSCLPLGAFNRVFLPLVVCGTVFAAGCGGGHDSGNRAIPVAPDDVTRTVTTSGESGVLRYALTMQDAYAIDDSISAQFSIENTGDDTIPFSYTSCSPIIARVSRDGEPINYDDYDGCKADTKRSYLVPHHKYTFSFALRRNRGMQANEPGQYKLSGKMYLNQQEVGPEPISFTIRPAS